jgi:glucose-6-phosphate 1-dehydrogenase
MRGEATLFTRADEVEEQWRVVDAMRAAWDEEPEFPNYAAGTWGPDAADELIARGDRAWRRR